MKNENFVLDENKDKNFESSKSNKIINDSPSSRPFNTLIEFFIKNKKNKKLNHLIIR